MFGEGKTKKEVEWKYTADPTKEGYNSDINKEIFDKQYEENLTYGKDRRFQRHLPSEAVDAVIASTISDKPQDVKRHSKSVFYVMILAFMLFTIFVAVKKKGVNLGFSSVEVVAKYDKVIEQTDKYKEVQFKVIECEKNKSIVGHTGIAKLNADAHLDKADVYEMYYQPTSGKMAFSKENLRDSSLYVSYVGIGLIVLFGILMFVKNRVRINNLNANETAQYNREVKHKYKEPEIKYETTKEVQSFMERFESRRNDTDTTQSENDVKQSDND